MKKQKGITLVALAITIIVLLILVVVSVIAITNDKIVDYPQNTNVEYSAVTKWRKCLILKNENW